MCTVLPNSSHTCILALLCFLLCESLCLIVGVVLISVLDQCIGVFESASTLSIPRVGLVVNNLFGRIISFKLYEVRVDVCY